MSRFSGGGMGRFQGPPSVSKIIKEGPAGVPYIDYKDTDSLRRMMSPNGKIHGRKRLNSSAAQQRMVARAIKRARFLGLLPYTSATL